VKWAVVFHWGWPVKLFVGYVTGRLHRATINHQPSTRPFPYRACVLVVLCPGRFVAVTSMTTFWPAVSVCVAVYARGACSLERAIASDSDFGFRVKLFQDSVSAIITADHQFPNTNTPECAGSGKHEVRGQTSE
jgi:hypothetical protein